MYDKKSKFYTREKIGKKVKTTFDLCFEFPLLPSKYALLPSYATKT